MQTYKELIEKVVGIDYIKFNVDVNSIIKNHGDKVFIFAMEECSEIQVAILDGNREDIIEESVDLLIVLSWIRRKLDEDTLIDFKRGYCTSAMPTERALRDLALGVKHISKLLRGERNLNSIATYECITMLNKVATCMLVDNGATEYEIQRWLKKKTDKIETKYIESTKGGVF